jgi:hypothetical protein
MTHPKVVYTLVIIEDGLERLRLEGNMYTVRLGRRGTPTEVAAELRMAADALEERFA